MQVIPLRSGSLGIRGTYRNAKCHAQKLVPMISFLDTQLNIYKASGKAKIKIWKQGHNVHEIEAADGRKFVFRPIWKRGGEEYIGLTLSLKVSRGMDIPLFNVFHDVRNNVSWQFVVDFLKAAGKRKDFPHHPVDVVKDN